LPGSVPCVTRHGPPFPNFVIHSTMRAAIQALQESRIREVANAGLGRTDLLAFWFGESDEITPAFVREAAAESLQRGETFYSHNLGLPELRLSIARWMGQAHGHLDQDRIAVTSGGVSALMLATQLLVGAGDDVVAVTPVWPNLTAQPRIMGANVRCVSLRPHQGAWRLDVDELCAAVTADTRMLVVNAPNNPTGWTLTLGEQRRILDHCRSTGTWIVADEVYERLYFAESSNGCAPSFLDIADPQDRLVVVHSFSKSFLMTGWRLGWMVLPAVATGQVGKLLEFNTSCAPVFVQRAAVAALGRADEIVPGVAQRLRSCRDTLVPQLQALPGVEVAAPLGGMYAFLHLSGSGDSLAVAKRLVAEAGLGLAPGSAFGLDDGIGDGCWLRWCFASRDPGRLVEGVGRLRRWLAA
jgi:aspartate/methionine/tyrosine aminotransferase